TLLKLLSPGRTPQFSFFFFVFEPSEPFLVVPMPLLLNLIERPSRRLNHWRLHESRRRNNSAPEIRNNGPGAIVSLGLDGGTAAHCAGQADDQRNRGIVERHLHAFRDVQTQTSE